MKYLRSGDNNVEIIEIWLKFSSSGFFLFLIHTGRMTQKVEIFSLARFQKKKMTKRDKSSKRIFFKPKSLTENDF